jgi:hypothetical protein
MVRPESITRYDLTLLFVPVCFLGAGIAAVLFHLEVHLALGLAAVASGPPLVDSIFLNPPSRPDRGDRGSLPETGPSR